MYEELRGLARAQMAKAAPQKGTMQPTVLVHEAYLRLLGRQRPAWRNRRHFFFAAARAMHDLLVEDARRKAARKRGGGRARVELDSLVTAADAPPDALLALDAALQSLRADNPRHFRMVQLRFFGGLAMSEVAEAMETPLRSLEREWRLVRAKLARMLADG